MLGRVSVRPRLSEKQVPNLVSRAVVFIPLYSVNIFIAALFTAPHHPNSKAVQRRRVGEKGEEKRRRRKERGRRRDRE